MFAILKIKPDEKDFWTRIKNRIKPPKPFFERINVRSAAPFYYLEIYRSQCDENYTNIANTLGSCSKSIILCNDTLIKENTSLKLYKPTIFPNILTLNSVSKMLDNKDKKLKLGIIDEKGTFSQYLEMYLQFVSEIRVFTKNEKYYNDVAEKLFDKWGISIIICNSDKSIGNCDIVVSPENNFNRFFNNSVLIKNENGSFDILKGENITLPNEYSSLCPKDVDINLFSAALYETCGVKELKYLSYDKMNCIYKNVLLFDRKISH